MSKLSKYKKQIFGFITMFLLLEFGVYPCLTAADTFANIIGAIALLIMSVWGILELKELFQSEDITRIPPGETELDYVPAPPPKMKAKTKTTKTKTTKTK